MSVGGRGDDPERDTRGEEAIKRLAFRLDEIARRLGISRRSLERERSAGRFPPPDRVIGKMPVWTDETLRRYLKGGRS